MGGRHGCRSHQDRAGARGPGLCVEASPGGSAATRALATGLTAGHPRTAARRRLRATAQRPKPGTASALSRPTTGSRNRPPMQRIRAMRLHPAMWMTVAALPAPDAVTATKTKALRQIPPATTVRKSRRAGIGQQQRGLETIRADARQPRPLRHRRGHGRGRAPRRHRRARRIVGGHARRGAGVGRGHAPGREPRPAQGTRRARSRRRSGKRTGASSTGGRCCAAT